MSDIDDAFAAAGAPVLPAAQAPPNTGANIGGLDLAGQAAIINTLGADYDPVRDAGNPKYDIRKYFPQPDGMLFGLLGKGDAIPPELEKLLTPKGINIVQEFMGPSEITTPTDDQGAISSFITRMVGRAPTPDQRQRIFATIREARNRGDSWFGGDYLRTIREIMGFVPSEAEVAAKPPTNIEGGVYASAVPEGGWPAYKIETPKAAVQFLKNWGITPVTETPDFAQRSRAAANWIGELETIDPGVSSQVIGPILAADFNERFRNNPGDTPVTVADLDIKAQVLPGNNKPILSFINPADGNRIPFDPVNFEWGTDIAEWGPEALVIGGDVGGSLVGAKLGFAGGPKTMALGTIGGGALGAYGGKVAAQRIALDKAEFVYDATQGGFVNPKVARDKQRVIRWQNILYDSIPTALWSAAGGTVGTLLFKIGRSILSKGNQAVANAIDKDQFMIGLKEFGESKLGIEMAEQDVTASAAMILERRANTLIDEGKQLGGAGAAENAAMAQNLFRQAQVLRGVEEAGSGGAGARASAQKVGEAEIAKLGGTTVKDVAEADPVKFGQQVAEGMEGAQVLRPTVEAGARTEGMIPGLAGFQRNIDELLTANTKGIDELNTLVKTRSSPDATQDFAASLIERASKIFGKPNQTAADGYVGLYGAVEAVRNAGRQYSRRAFNIDEVHSLVDKAMKFKGYGQGLPQKVVDKFNRLKNSGPNLTFEATENALAGVRLELKSDKLSLAERRNLVAISESIERSLRKGLGDIDAQNLLKGNQTTLAKDWTSATDQLRQGSEIFKNGILGNLQRGEINNVEKILLGGKEGGDFSSRQIQDIFSSFKFTKKEKDLLRAIVERNYRNNVLGRGGSKIGAEGKGTVTLPGGQQVETVAGGKAAHKQFIDTNSALLNKLFPDDPQLSKFGDPIKVVAENAESAKKLMNSMKTLRAMPWFKNVFGVTEDFRTIIAQEPQKLVDEMLANNVKATEALNIVLRAVRSLPKADAKLAEETLKAISMRKVFNPDALQAASVKGVAEIDGYVRNSLDVLDQQVGYFNRLYGIKGTQNMKLFLKDLQSVLAPGAQRIDQAGVQKVVKEAERIGDVSIPLMFAKLYVGVLNTKARALRMAQLKTRSAADQKVADAVYDAEKFAKILRQRKPEGKRLTAEKTLSNILGIDIAETTGLLEDYDALMNEIPTPYQPISVQDQLFEVSP